MMNPRPREASPREPRCSRLGHVALLALAATATLATAAAAEDWSQWRGPDRNGHAEAFTIPEAWPEAPEQKWRVEVGEGYTSPVVVGDRIYLMARQGEEEVAMALDLATGKTLWKSAFQAPYVPHQAAVKYGKGPKATPAVAEGVACFLGIDARFSCHDAKSGKVLWVRDYSEASAPEETFCGSAFSPLIEGGTVFVHLGDDRAGRLFAADLRTGEEKWGWEGQGPGYASPFMLEVDGVRQFVTFATTDLLAFEPKTGELLWQRAYPDKWRENIVDPLVVGERILISDYENGTLSLWPSKTEKGWKVEDHWHNKELTQRMASPVTDGTWVYGFSNRKKGQLFVLDPASGKVVWNDEGRGGDNVTLTVAGAYLLVSTTAAELKVFKRKGEELVAQKTYEIAPSSVWSHPAWLADGLLVKDERHLTRLVLETKPPEPAQEARTKLGATGSEATE